jgi:hypothetical protein
MADMESGEGDSPLFKRHLSTKSEPTTRNSEPKRSSFARPVVPNETTIDELI